MTAKNKQLQEVANATIEQDTTIPKQEKKTLKRLVAFLLTAKKPHHSLFPAAQRQTMFHRIKILQTLTEPQKRKQKKSNRKNRGILVDRIKELIRIIRQSLQKQTQPPKTMIQRQGRIKKAISQNVLGALTISHKPK
jgi:hypothetical protein